MVTIYGTSLNPTDLFEAEETSSQTFRDRNKVCYEKVETVSSVGRVLLVSRGRGFESRTVSFSFSLYPKGEEEK